MYNNSRFLDFDKLSYVHIRPAIALQQLMVLENLAESKNLQLLWVYRVKCAGYPAIVLHHGGDSNPAQAAMGDAWLAQQV